jgi:hypothetical protein
MKKLVLVAAMAAASMTACSKDDGPSKNCESCNLSDTKIEVCDNGDGTWTISLAGSTTTTDPKLLGAGDLTPKQYAESLCDSEEPSL